MRNSLLGYVLAPQKLRVTARRRYSMGQRQEHRGSQPSTWEVHMTMVRKISLQGAKGLELRWSLSF